MNAKLYEKSIYNHVILSWINQPRLKITQFWLYRSYQCQTGGLVVIVKSAFKYYCKCTSKILVCIISLDKYFLKTRTICNYVLLFSSLYHTVFYITWYSIFSVQEMRVRIDEHCSFVSEVDCLVNLMMNLYPMHFLYVRKTEIRIIKFDVTMDFRHFNENLILTFRTNFWSIYRFAVFGWKSGDSKNRKKNSYTNWNRVIQIN